MTKQKYSEKIITAVVKQQKLEYKLILEMSKCSNHDVHFLVGGNPNLSPSEIDLFINLKDDYARSGTALNPNLTSNQISQLFKDPSHTVYSKLAQNKAINSKTLLMLHRERNPGLVYFAMNENCPEEVKKEIIRSSDSQAKQWLKTTSKGRNNLRNSD